MLLRMRVREMVDKGCMKWMDKAERIFMEKVKACILSKECKDIFFLVLPLVFMKGKDMKVEGGWIRDMTWRV